MGLQLKNNASTTLAGALLSTATTFSVASGDGAKFPALSAGDWFPVTVVDSSANIEVMKCTAIAGDVLTVIRGEEGTAAAAFASGSRVDLRITAAAIAEIQTNIANLQTLSATLASPALTGDPTAPTQANADNSTNIATTAYVTDALVNGVPGASPVTYAGVPSGFIGFTLALTAPAGWLMFNDSTVGDGSSGATYAAANAQAVFNLLYAFSDANCPLLTSVGSATTRSAQGAAAAAWAAHCRITLPLTLGRALAAAGSGSGLTARNPGDTVGEETHTLSTTETPSHTHTQQGDFGTDQTNLIRGSIVGQDLQNGATPTFTLGGGSSVQASVTISGQTASTGGDGAHNNIQPTAFLNVIVKL